MILQRFILCQFHDVFRQRQISGIGFLYGFLCPFRFFLVQQIGVVDDLFTLCLEGESIQQSVGFQSFGILRKATVGTGGFQLFHTVFCRHSLQFRITQRCAIGIKAAFGFGVCFAEFTDKFNKLFGRVFIVLIVHIFGSRGCVGIFRGDLADLGTVYPCFTAFAVIGGRTGQQTRDFAQNLRIAPLDKLFKRRNIRIVNQIVAQMVGFGIMGLIRIHVEQIQGVIRHEGVRTARLYLSVQFADKHHHLAGLIFEFPHVVVKVLFIIYFFKMRIFHIQQRQIRNSVVRIIRCLIPQINKRFGRGVMIILIKIVLRYLRRTFVEIRRAENVAFTFTSLLCL